MISRNLAIETAMGFLSTPCTDASALLTASQGSAVSRRLPPPFQQATERAEEKGARAAHGVDDPQVRQPELVHGRLEGVIEDEFPDERRRLQQRVRRPLMLGQVLVKVTEETAYPIPDQ